MKNTTLPRQFTPRLLIYSALIFCGCFALAQTAPNLDVPTEPSTGNPVILNPASIRNMLLEGNTSIMQSAIRVQQAREQLFQTRGNLLPNLNVGAVLISGGSIGIGPVSASVLLPFLLPHTWFDNLRAKNVVEAEKAAYMILELNQLNSALAVYFSYLNSLDARDAQLQEVQQYERIERSAAKAYQLGIIRKDEYEQAKAQTSLARVQVTRINDLIVQERAQLRHTLGLRLNQGINIERVNLPENPKENLTAQELLAKAVAKAPERTQLSYLLKAAKAEKWVKIFSFISGVSVSRSFNQGFPSAGGFDALVGNSQLNFGLGMIPNIRLSNSEQKRIQEQERELRLEISEVLERTVQQLTVTKERMRQATDAETALASAFDIKLKRYELGIETFTSVLVTRSQLREAMLERLRTQSELNTLRASLDRIFVEGEYGKVRGCTLNAFAQEKKKRIFILSWFKDIVVGDSNRDWMSVERLCSARKR